MTPKEKTAFEKAGLKVAPASDMDYNAEEHGKQLQKKYGKGEKNMESNGREYQFQVDLSARGNGGVSSMFHLRTDDKEEVMDFLGIDVEEEDLNQESVKDALEEISPSTPAITPAQIIENKLPVFDNGGKPVTCHFCGGEVFDNTTKPKKFATGPDYKCMGRSKPGCNGAAWFKETGGLNWSNKSNKAKKATR